MKQIRKRLTYANVMSSIAVFLILGGATAFAASHLGKNSVGTKQLKKNSVTAAKIKDGAVTGAKVKLSTLGTVPNATNATHSSSADKATNADNATNAGNANTVGGNTVRKFFYASNETNATQTILSLDGLNLTASCPGGTPKARATTSVNDSLIHSGGEFGGGTEPFYVEEDDFKLGEEFDFLESGVTFNDSIEGTLTYAQPGGAVVTAVYAVEEGAFNSFATDCLISGYAIG